MFRPRNIHGVKISVSVPEKKSFYAQVDHSLNHYSMLTFENKQDLFEDILISELKKDAKMNLLAKMKNIEERDAKLTCGGGASQLLKRINRQLERTSCRITPKL